MSIASTYHLHSLISLHSIIQTLRTSLVIHLVLAVDSRRKGSLADTFAPIGARGCGGTDYVTGRDWRGNWTRVG